MNILAIPGKKQGTEPWLKAVLENIKMDDKNVDFHRFVAWSKDDDSFDLNEEVENLPTGTYDILITKSIGTLAVVRSMEKYSLKKIIFIGVALSLYNEEDKKLLKELTDKGIELLVIQEDKDPFGGYEEVVAALPANDKVRHIEVKGDDHLYPDTAALGEMITEWL